MEDEEEEEDHALSQMDGDVEHNGEALPQLMHNVVEDEEEHQEDDEAGDENPEAGLKEVGEAEDLS